MRLYLPDGLLKRPDADISDLTAAKPKGNAYWEPGDMLARPMDREPTEAEKVKIRRRMVTTDDTDEQRLLDLLTARAQAKTLFERLWLDTELAKYGETYVEPPAPGKKK